MIEVTVGDAVLELPDDSTPEQIEQAVEDYSQRVATEDVRVATSTGVDPRTIEQFEAGQATTEDLGLPQPESPFVGAYDALKAIGSSVAAPIAAGVVGVGDFTQRAVTGDDPYKAGGDVDVIRKALTYTPKTESGKQILENLGQFVETVNDYVPIMDAIEWLDATGVEGGEAAEELGLPPSVSAFIQTSPQVLPELLAFAKTPKAVEKLIQAGSGVVSKAVEPVKNYFKAPTKFKQEIARQIIEGDRLIKSGGYDLKPIEGDFIPAGDKLPARSGVVDIDADNIPVIDAPSDTSPAGIAVAGEQSIAPDDGRSLEELDMTEADLEPQPQRKSLVQMIKEGDLKIEKSKTAKEAMRLGADQGTVSMIQGATGDTKRKMLAMLDIKNRSLNKKGSDDRAADVAGDALLDRYKYVLGVNKQAGKQIDLESKKLAGETVDLDTVFREYGDELDTLGIRINVDGSLDFSESTIKRIPEAQKIMSEITEELIDVYQKGSDAKKVHDLKKFIDAQVTYGKNKYGLKGMGEKQAKALRRNLNNLLGDNFPDYKKQNDIYSATIDVLDELQRVSPTNLDLNSKYAAGQIGVLLRRISSNAASRGSIIKLNDDLNSLAQKYGGEFNDDPKALALFADELDTMFGYDAATSFAGLTEKATARAFKGAIEDTESLINPKKWVRPVGKGIAGAAKAAKEKVKPTDTDAQFRAWRNLLEEADEVEKIKELKKKFGFE